MIEWNYWRWMRLDIDFFPCILPHVGDVEIAGLAIEREPPGVAQAIRPHFRRGVPVFDERIGGGNPVRFAALRVIHVDPQQFSQQRGPVLAVIVWISRAAPVPGAYIKVAVRSESQLAAVVVTILSVRDHQ